MDLEGQREQQYLDKVMLQLTERFGAARLPKKVKRQEAPFDAENNPTRGDIENADGVADAPVRLNSGWYDLTEEDGGFTPVASVKYLWVIREDGNLILGVEDPSKAPEAFGIDLATLDQDAKGAIEGLGHPTLAAKFGKGGVLQPGGGRIGGELFAAAGGGWAINDHSGRYGGGRPDPKGLLAEAAKEFARLGIPIAFIQSKATAENGGTDDQEVALVGQ